MSGTIEEYITNEYFIGALFLFTILYVNKCQIALPQYISSLFENDIFKIVYLVLLLMISFKTAPHVAIVVSIAFVLLAKTLQKK